MGNGSEGMSEVFRRVATSVSGLLGTPEPGLHSLQIGVETRDAAVTLTGTVDSPMLKERAKQIASSVSGVREVVDNLLTKTASS